MKISRAAFLTLALVACARVWAQVPTATPPVLPGGTLPTTTFPGFGIGATPAVPPTTAKSDHVIVTGTLTPSGKLGTASGTLSFSPAAPKGFPCRVIFRGKYSKQVFNCSLSFVNGASGPMTSAVATVDEGKALTADHYEADIRTTTPKYHLCITLNAAQSLTGQTQTPAPVIYPGVPDFLQRAFSGSDLLGNEVRIDLWNQNPVSIATDQARLLLYSSGGVPAVLNNNELPGKPDTEWFTGLRSQDA